jgi:PAS domain S-box-containing protein
VGAALGLGMVLVLSTMHRRVQAPLEHLLVRVQEVSSGELTKTLEIDPTEELGALKIAINEMSAFLLLAQEAQVEGLFLQGVIDAMPEALVVFDGNGVVEFTNRRFNLLEGIGRRPQLLGAGMGTLFGQTAPAWYDTLLTKGILSLHEVEFLGPDGQTVPVLASGSLMRDEDGEAARIILVVHDRREIDELTHKLGEANYRVAESESFFQNLFDAMEDPITVLDLDGQVLQANRAARATFGNKVVGQKCYRAFRMRTEVCSQCPAMQTFVENRSVSVEHRAFGNAITRISTYPLLGKNGQVQAIINHKRDVTKERQVEDLKANFLAAVSHELRTPLTSLMGFNKLNIRRLTRYVAPQLEEAPHKVRVSFRKVLDDMEVMDSEAARLGRLVNDVLDFSKLSAGRLTLNWGDVDIKSMVDGAVAATSVLWRQKSLLVEVATPPDLPPAYGDGDRLSQIVVNLLSNAIKFTERGTITVEVEADEDWIIIAVRDPGRGIPADQLTHVFERFQQVQSAEAGHMGGTGLGLPICRQLVGLHGGEIEVESTMGEGSVFTFTVPRGGRVQHKPVAVQPRTSFSLFDSAD